MGKFWPKFAHKFIILFSKSWVNSIYKKTPKNHSAVLIWNLDLATTHSNGDNGDDNDDNDDDKEDLCMYHMHGCTVGCEAREAFGF